MSAAGHRGAITVMSCRVASTEWRNRIRLPAAVRQLGRDKNDGAASVNRSARCRPGARAGVSWVPSMAGRFAGAAEYPGFAKLLSAVAGVMLPARDGDKKAAMRAAILKEVPLVMTSLTRMTGRVAVLALLAVAAAGRVAAGQPLVLAVSWQPAFCETRPTVPECATQTGDRFDATNFALHGLWPEPRENVYCGVAADQRAADRAGRWADLPAVGLTTGTRAALERTMPGSRSFLHRHQWVKHGTCYGTSPEGYFADALRLMEELNASPVRALFADGIGRAVTGREIRRRFDAAFGPGAGDRVELTCRRVGARRLILELKIALAGPVAPDRGLGAMLAAASVRQPGCASGIVDRVGTGLTDDPS